MSEQNFFVLDQAICECSKGSVVGKLKATAQTIVRLQGKLKATEKDKIFEAPFFGNCNKDPKTPCVPALQNWDAPTTKTTFAGSQQFLLHNSTCQCQKGGEVSIKDHGQLHAPIQSKQEDPVYPILKGNCVAYFRPFHGFKYEFGFDWVRRHDFEGDGDINFDEVMGYDMTIPRNKRGEHGKTKSFYFVKYDNFENYRDNFFNPIYDIPWIAEKEVQQDDTRQPNIEIDYEEKISTKIKVKEKYSCAWLNLFSTEEAKLQLGIITKKEGEKLYKPQTLRLAYNKNTLVVKCNGVEGKVIADAEIGQKAFMVYVDLPITDKEKYKIPDITVSFKDKKNITNTETIRVLCDGEWAGQLNIGANGDASTRKVNVLFVDVRTGEGDSKLASKKHDFAKQKEKLKFYLNQALVTLQNYQQLKLNFSITEETLKDFKDKYIEWVQDPQNAADTIPKVLTTKQDPQNISHEAFFTYLNTTLQTQLGKDFALYTNYHKVYFFAEEGQDGTDTIAGVARGFNTKEAAVFLGRTENVQAGDDNTAIHEILHCYGLLHTFEANNSIKTQTTNNIMDYCTASKIKRVSTFKYQWDIVKAGIAP